MQNLKRSWVLAVALTVAISLTNCANKKSNYSLGGAGYGTCNGALGNFNVTLEPTSDNYSYVLSISPTSGFTPGDIVSVTIANGSQGYRTLVTETTVMEGDVITAGPLTANDLQQYDILAITPYSPGQDFFSQNSSADTYCYIPQPGDQAH